MAVGYEYAALHTITRLPSIVQRMFATALVVVVLVASGALVYVDPAGSVTPICRSKLTALQNGFYLATRHKKKKTVL